MLIPKLQMLDGDLVKQIISEAIAILENPGVRIHNQEALELLAGAHAKVDFEAQVACIPERLSFSEVIGVHPGIVFSVVILEVRPVHRQ